MSDSIHYTACPVCGSANVFKKLSVIDFAVSGEVFPVFHCSACSLRFTQDVPDPASIGRYYKSEDYISHTDSAKGLINQLYHSVRKIALQQKRRLVEKAAGMKGGSLLDIGSGTGSFAAVMQKAGWRVTGLEPDAGARKLAAETNDITLLAGDELFHLPEKNYDVITLWHVLEHVHDLYGYIRQFKRLLKPGGRLIVAVPNYTSLDADIYKQCWAAYDVPRHLYHFTPQSIKLLMEKNDLKIRAIKPMWFDSFYVSLLSSRYKNTTTDWAAALWIGFRSNVKALFNRKRCSSLIYIISA